jgi:hypothetical protein
MMEVFPAPQAVSRTNGTISKDVPPGNHGPTDLAQARYCAAGGGEIR